MEEGNSNKEERVTTSSFFSDTSLKTQFISSLFKIPMWSRMPSDTKLKFSQTETKMPLVTLDPNKPKLLTTVNSVRSPNKRTTPPQSPPTPHKIGKPLIFDLEPKFLIFHRANVCQKVMAFAKQKRKSWNFFYVKEKHVCRCWFCYVNPVEFLFRADMLSYVITN